MTAVANGTVDLDESFISDRNALENFHGIIPVKLPDELNTTLRNYQNAGYDWFHFLKSFGFGGCLADDMGLGKTLQAISLLVSQKGSGANLVVAPCAVIWNWESEVRKFAPGLTMLIYHGEKRHDDAHQIPKAEFITRNSIEERVIAFQKEKLILAGHIISE